MVSEVCCLAFSGLRIRFRFPSPAVLPKEFVDLRCAESGEFDEEFDVRLISTPLEVTGSPVSTDAGHHIYPTDQGCLRIYTPVIRGDGCQVACLLRDNGKHTLFYPASQWHFYNKDLHVAHLIGGEEILLRHNAFLLHSSVVMINGKAVLFSGPSGVGKSTQADLWVKHRGAELINGDRCVVMLRDGIFFGGGSMWGGSSGIHRPEQAPIAGIFLVKQSPENSVELLGGQAFVPLFA